MTITKTVSDAPTTNTKLVAWVERVADLCNPDSIHWCDGSQEEYDAMIRL